MNRCRYCFVEVTADPKPEKRRLTYREVLDSTELWDPLGAHCYALWAIGLDEERQRAGLQSWAGWAGWAWFRCRKYPRYCSTVCRRADSGSVEARTEVIASLDVSTEPVPYGASGEQLNLI